MTREEYYREMVAFRSELRAYAEMMSCYSRSERWGCAYHLRKNAGLGVLVPIFPNLLLGHGVVFCLMPPVLSKIHGLHHLHVTQKIKY